MGRMVRKQVYIEPRQDALLKKRAAELGVTEAELVRRGIDQVIRSGGRPFFPDPQAWLDLKAFMEERRTMQVPQTGRVWTREELYDERLDRYSA